MNKRQLLIGISATPAAVLPALANDKPRQVVLDFDQMQIGESVTIIKISKTTVLIAPGDDRPFMVCTPS